MAIRTRLERLERERHAGDGVHIVFAKEEAGVPAARAEAGVRPGDRVIIVIDPNMDDVPAPPGCGTRRIRAW